MHEFKHVYTCPGCDKDFELTTRIRDAAIKKQHRPAYFIATEKMLTEREAALQHARVGCRRPV
jgi:hypothetical protein